MAHAREEESEIVRVLLWRLACVL